MDTLNTNMVDDVVDGIPFMIHLHISSHLVDVKNQNLAWNGTSECVVICIIEVEMKIMAQM